MPRYYTRRNQIAVPKGSHLGYRTGRGYYVAPGRPRPRPKPVTLDALLTSGLSGLMQTPAQQRTQARTLVNDALADQLSALRQTTRAAQEQANRQAGSAEAFAKTMAGYSQADAEALRNIQQGARTDLTAISDAVARATYGAQEGALTADQAYVNRIAPGGVMNAPSPAAARQVALKLGSLPADTAGVLGNAAYEGSLIRNMAERNQLAQMAGEYRRKTTDLQAELARNRMDLEAKRPALLREAVQSLRGERRQDLATILSALALQNTQTGTLGNLALGQSKVAADAAKAQADALAEQGLTPQGTLLPGYYPTKAGPQPVPRGYTWNGTRLVKTPAGYAPTGKAGSTPKGATPKVAQQIVSKAQTDIRKVIRGQPYSRVVNPGEVFLDLPPKYGPSMSYAQAKAKLLLYAPPAWRKDKRILNMIDDALRSVGYRIGGGTPKNPGYSSPGPR